MSLTGSPLIVLAAFGTLAAVAATVLGWNRFGRVRYLVRVAGVLLAEVLLLLSVGLAVNRSEQFYPTWDALLGTAPSLVTTQDKTYRSTPGALDQELAARAAGRTGDAQTFLWQSADWHAWGLAAAPTVITPPGYLLHPTWAYSVVLVVGVNPASWTAAQEGSAARRASATGISAVVVFATTTAATTAPALATALPARLDRDLRVTTHRWAIVAAADDAALADTAVADAAARYPSIAVVPAGAQRTTPAGAQPTAPAGAQPTAPAGALPAGVTAAAVVEGSPAAAPPAGVVPLPSTASDALYTALSWAIGRTPPPLASPPPSTRRCGCHPTAKR
ncbi:hypothetical protein ODJ79_28885 [Actinoplanes sp. KI2]|uniref:hypothetical protein n=1 Tax=Actinoplanes sp. KI2 TaxID=2983315 RepID=UPI0021D5C670|nr:hypothetical protein [Actinoplanes sp. KI2]MCU7727753.1 hypothetical protein [Actinoplanes sp. KI2]